MYGLGLWGYYQANAEELKKAIPKININYTKIKREPDGLSCRRCKDFVHMAESNCDDGTFVCYLCRSNPYR